MNLLILKNKRPKNLRKVQQFLPTGFFKIMLVTGNEMYTASIAKKAIRQPPERQTKMFFDDV